MAAALSSRGRSAPSGRRTTPRAVLTSPKAAASRAGTTFRNLREGEEEEEEQETEVEKALKIPEDHRFQEMTRYTETAAASARSPRGRQPRGAIDSLREKGSSWPVDGGLEEDAASPRSPASPASAASPALSQRSAASPLPPIVAPERVWEDSFDRSVKRLLVDFQLTDTPSCRLNHLERMHAWFSTHGQKPPRKVPEGPSYLTTDRGGTLPAGSTKNLPGKMSDLSQTLASSFSPRNGTTRSRLGRPC